MYSLATPRLQRIIVALTVLMLVLSNLTSAKAQEPVAPGAAGLPKGVIASPQSELALAAAEPWTKEEMLAAEPLDSIAVDPAALAAAPAVAAENSFDVAGGPKAEAGAAPSLRRPRPGMELAVGEAAALPEVSDADLAAINPATFAPGDAYAWPPPFTRHEAYTGRGDIAARYAIYPYSAVGKVFFRRGTGNFVCSASVVNLRTIVTAGHCIHAGNNSASGWSTSIYFVPAYYNGAAPLGVWAVGPCWTTTDWYAFGIPNGLRRDIATCRVAPQGGYNIGQRTGWLGFAVNQNPKQHFTMLGYPQAAPFNGLRMFQCSASTNRFDTAVGGAGPYTLGMGCDQTPGASGSPWIIGWNPYGAGWVNGNYSYYYTNVPLLQVYGPYYDNLAWTLRNLAA